MGCQLFMSNDEGLPLQYGSGGINNGCYASRVILMLTNAAALRGLAYCNNECHAPRAILMLIISRQFVRLKIQFMQKTPILLYTRYNKSS